MQKRLLLADWVSESEMMNPRQGVGSDSIKEETPPRGNSGELPDICDATERRVLDCG